PHSPVRGTQMQQGIMLRPMSTSELLDASFGLYRRLFGPLMFVALCTLTLPQALGVYVEVAGGVTEQPLLWLVGVIVSLILSQVGIAASTFLVAESYLGGTITPQDAFRRAAPFVGRLIAAAFASALLYFVGMLLLIIPAIIFICALAVTAPALVLENQSSAVAGMSRSWNLTKGFRGKVFLAYFVAILLIFLPAIALGAFGLAAAAAAGSMEPSVIVVLLMQMVLQILAYPFLFVLTTLLYYDLRVRKEGYDLEMLSASLGAA
ncbi:MAG: hypothetical protein ACT4P7_19750, partial [Gemmatimonadaceae bacterium]